jgi:hypothetical protein
MPWEKVGGIRHGRYRYFTPLGATGMVCRG